MFSPWSCTTSEWEGEDPANSTISLMNANPAIECVGDSTWGMMLFLSVFGGIGTYLIGSFYFVNMVQSYIASTMESIGASVNMEEDRERFHHDLGWISAKYHLGLE